MLTAMSTTRQYRIVNHTSVETNPLQERMRVRPLNKEYPPEYYIGGSSLQETEEKIGYRHNLIVMIRPPNIELRNRLGTKRDTKSL
jgi:hypothetical protein